MLSDSLMRTRVLVFFTIALSYYNAQLSYIDISYIFSRRGRTVGVTQTQRQATSADLEGQQTKPSRYNVQVSTPSSPVSQLNHIL